MEWVVQEGEQLPAGEQLQVELGELGPADLQHGAHQEQAAQHYLHLVCLPSNLSERLSAISRLLKQFLISLERNTTILMQLPRRPSRPTIRMRIPSQ